MTNYDDIINLPHHVSTKHKQMPIESRAAQFAPFQALTGYSDEVKETARLTEEKINLDSNRKSLLNSKLQLINEFIKDNPKITFTYFIKDSKKQGGKYTVKTGNVKKIDHIEQFIILTDKTKIPINDITDIIGDLFK